MITTNGIKIRFLYRREFVFIKTLDKNEWRDTCTCTLIDLSGNKLYSEGKSIRNPSDNSCKKEARKRALTHALKNSTFSKEERTLIWNEYFLFHKK